MKEKQFIEGVLKKENNLVSVIASSDTKDRDGDILNPQGWKLERFKKNPVILWSHRPDLLPIGKAPNAYIQENQLIVDVEFAEHEFAQEVKKLVDDGYINTTSVGFMPLDEKGEENELLEVSFVNVPSNPDAQVLREFAMATKAFESKKVEEPVKEKEGRVISEKNRNIMRIAKESLAQSINALDDVLEASEPKPKQEPTPEKKKGVQNIQPKKQGKTVNKTLRLVKLIDKVAEAAICEIKEGGENK